MVDTRTHYAARSSPLRMPHQVAAIDRTAMPRGPMSDMAGAEANGLLGDLGGLLRPPFVPPPYPHFPHPPYFPLPGWNVF